MYYVLYKYHSIYAYHIILSDTDLSYFFSKDRCISYSFAVLGLLYVRESEKVERYVFFNVLSVL